MLSALANLLKDTKDEAKALAIELAPLRTAPAVNPAVNRPGLSKKVADDHSQLINPNYYIAELNSPEWQEGFKQGQQAKSAGASGRMARFARLRRHSPEIADQFLSGNFIKRFKNGRVQADMVAAEIAAGIRKSGDNVRKADPAAYCIQLASKFNTDQLTHLQSFINQLLESRK